MVNRVVFDTNVLISAYLWKGSARKALEMIRTGDFTLLVSKDTVNELIHVLAYDKFGLTPQEIQPIVRDLMNISEFVEVKSEVQAIKADPTDDIFLALAIDGNADAIVSGDHHLLYLKEFEAIPIMTIRRFLSVSS